MTNQAVLLAIVLAFTLPAFADTQPKATASSTSQKAKPKGSIQKDSFSFGAINTGSTGKPGATGKSSAGNPNLQNPCKGPNPPRSCKQNKPAH